MRAAPLESTKAISCSSTKNVSSKITDTYFQVCSHGETARSSPISLTEMTMRNFIDQSILSIQPSEMPETVPVNLSGAKFIFVEESKELF